MRFRNLRQLFKLSFFLSVFVIACTKTNAQIEYKDAIVIVEDFKKKYYETPEIPFNEKSPEIVPTTFYNETYDVGGVKIKEFIEISECSGDSVFRYFYTNGVLTEGDLEVSTFFVGEFPPLSNKIFKGMNKADIVKILGTPYRESNRLLTYNSIDEIESLHSTNEKTYLYESIRVLLDQKGKVISVWILTKSSC